MAARLQLFVAILQLLVISFNCAKQILCDNAGQQWAAFKAGSAAQNYNSFNPNYMKDPSITGGTGTTNLLYNSVTTKVGVGGCPDVNANVSMYDSPKCIPCINHTIMLRGYINPSISGIFAFNLHTIDQLGFFWLGARARSGWHRQNHDLEAAIDRPWRSQTRTQYESNATFFWLDAGSYYPIRIIHANELGGYTYLMSIVDSLGNTILGANTGPSTSIVQYSCDGSTAPDWAAWGKEA